MGSLIIRADADTRIGTGHLMRCLALGQAWKDAGGQVALITACSNDRLLQHLYNEGFIVRRLERPYANEEDWKVTGKLMSEHPHSWLVLDGYRFDSDYQRQVKDAGYRLMVIDDMAHLSHYYADIVLNQNIHAKDLRYSREPYTRLLLGTRYVLLRREFLRWRGWKRQIPGVACKVLATLGGGDPDNVTLKVIQALQQLELPDLEARVVVGPTNAHLETLRQEVERSTGNMQLLTAVTHMSDLMAWADIAVSAGGSTCWEMAFMGLPSLALVLAANQRPIVERLDTVGVAVNLGWYETLVPAEITQELTRLSVAAGMRAEMARKGQRLVDGEGDRRALMSVEGRRIRLRPVCEGDCKLLWEWANDPDVRTVSFSSTLIPWEEHIQWFKLSLDDPHCIIYIALGSGGVPIGQVRYNIKEEDNEAIISLIIDRKFRGKGYGSTVISLASQKLFDVTDVSVIHAYVKNGNKPSVLSFVKAGFRDMGTAEVRGHQAAHLILQENRLI